MPQEKVMRPNSSTLSLHIDADEDGDSRCSMALSEQDLIGLETCSHVAISAPPTPLSRPPMYSLKTNTDKPAWMTYPERLPGRSANVKLGKSRASSRRAPSASRLPWTALQGTSVPYRARRLGALATRTRHSCSI